MSSTQPDPPTAAPTAAWKAAAPELPPLTSAAANNAESLLLLVHYGIEWDSWIADHRHRYWDELLPSRVTAATYRADSLPTWWSLLNHSLPLAVVDRRRRLETAQLLAEPGAPVLEVLREQMPALILRVRLIAESVAETRRAARTATSEPR